MKIKFNTKDAPISENTMGKMEMKLEQRLRKYFKDEPEEVEMFVKVVDKKPISKIELTVSYWGYMLRAEAQDSKSIMVALDRVIDVMDRQIEKCKTRHERKRQQKLVEPSMVQTDEEFGYNIIRVKSYDMKPLTVQEAIAEMDLLGHNFFMFFNRENGKICTAYRRNDGNFGLIQPSNM